MKLLNGILSTASAMLVSLGLAVISPSAYAGPVTLGQISSQIPICEAGATNVPGILQNASQLSDLLNGYEAASGNGPIPQDIPSVSSFVAAALAWGNIPNAPSSAQLAQMLTTCLSGSGGSNDPSISDLPVCSPASSPYTSSPVPLANVAHIFPLGWVDSSVGALFPSDSVTFVLGNDPTTNTQKITPITTWDHIRIIGVQSFSYMTSTGVTSQSYSVKYVACQGVGIRIDGLASLGAKVQSGLAGGSTPNCNGNSCYQSVSVDLYSGDLIGSAGGPNTNQGVGMATFDSTITLPFADPSRINSDTEGFDDHHAGCPLLYYSKTASSQLLALLGNGTMHQNPVNTTRCGQVNQDVIGAAKGKWFNPLSTATQDMTDLALVQDQVTGNLVLSMGTTFSSTLRTDSYSVGSAFNPINPYANVDFSKVTAATNTIYCYDHLFSDNGHLPYGNPGAVLIQMTSPTTMSVQHQKTTYACPANPQFIGTPAQFVR